MRFQIAFVTFVILCATPKAYALEPDQILVIANSDISLSVRAARYYCVRRKVPADNILALPLGPTLADSISRNDYEKKLAGPIRKKLLSPDFPPGKIRCLLTTYGVPIKVGARGPLKDQREKLEKLKELARLQKNELKLLGQNTSPAAVEKKKKIKRNLTKLQYLIDPISGKETNASVDSELSMVLADDYELYRWRPNMLKLLAPYWDFKTLMVSRLDGPGETIAMRLVDKAIAAEQIGLRGTAYIDSGYSSKKKNHEVDKYDKSLWDAAWMLRQRTDMKVVEERTGELFGPGACPNTALYCGWYSLRKYIDAFDYVDGAIGYHIASLEAVNLRDPNSSQWCPAMLRDGITATIGAVAEPYLHSFPMPKEFFAELLKGRCLVEAYYYTKPFNSWQLVLIGDPLYKPFRKP